MSDTAATLPEATLDPTASATGVRLYAKDVAGIKQLFTRASDGTIHQITPGGVDVVLRAPLPNPASAPIQFMAITADDSRVYTAGGGDIWYFDATTQLWNAVPITTGGSGPTSLAISPDGTKLYVSNFGAGTVTVVSLPAFTLLTTISGWVNPYDMAFTPDGTELWVIDSATAQSNVRRINVASDTLVGLPIALSTGLNPQDICFLPDGSKAYVAVGNILAVAVIDTTTHLTTFTIDQTTIGGQVFGVGAKPDGTEVWVCGGTNNAIYRVETTGNTIVGSPIPTTFPRGVEFTPDGTKAITTTSGPDGVKFIDVASATVTTTALGGVNPAYVLIDHTGTNAYLSSYSTPDVAVFDIASETFAANVNSTGIVDTNFGSFDTLVFSGVSMVDEGVQVLIAVPVAPAPPVIEISAANVLTFRPGSGLTGPVVFDDFNALYAQFDTLRSAADVSGKFKIVFDDQDVGGPGSTVVLDSGPGTITYDFLYAELIGVHEDVNVLLDIQDGGGETDSLTIINALWFEGLTIRATGQDTAFDALAGQTFTLTRTVFLGGGGQYVMDFLGVGTGCVIHLNNESGIFRADGTGAHTVFPAGTAAIRVNTSTVTVHANGANCQVNGNAFITGGGGVLVALVNSSSARFNFDQSDVGGVTGTMSAAAGYWTRGPAFPITNPNGNLTATSGTLIVDEATGLTWRNTDGATAWVITSVGFATRTTAISIANTETVVVSLSIPANTLVAGQTYKFFAGCNQTGINAAAPTVRIRIGTVTLTGNIAVAMVGNAGTAATDTVYIGQFTVRTIGGGGAAVGQMSGIKDGTASTNVVGASVAINTTVANLLEMTFISGNAANTYEFMLASIEQVG